MIKMNILLKEPINTQGLELPRDFRRACEEGVDFKIAEDELIKEAMDKGPGSYEYDVWLPTIKINTFRMIIFGLMHQLLEAKRPWYNKLYRYFKFRFCS